MFWFQPSCLCEIIVLQQAGRNPSQKLLSKYWTPRTQRLNFDDFCEILRKEKPTEHDDILRVFRKLDINGDGYISQDELHRVLTTVCTYWNMLLNDASCQNVSGVWKPTTTTTTLFCVVYVLQTGEKMTDGEVNEIFSLFDINKDGKLDYAEVNPDHTHTATAARSNCVMVICAFHPSWIDHVHHVLFTMDHRDSLDHSYRNPTL